MEVKALKPLTKNYHLPALKTAKKMVTTAAKIDVAGTLIVGGVATAAGAGIGLASTKRLKNQMGETTEKINKNFKKIVEMNKNMQEELDNQMEIINVHEEKLNDLNDRLAKTEAFDKKMAKSFTSFKNKTEMRFDSTDKLIRDVTKHVEKIPSKKSIREMIDDAMEDNFNDLSDRLSDLEKSKATVNMKLQDLHQRVTELEETPAKVITQDGSELEVHDTQLRTEMEQFKEEQEARFEALTETVSTALQESQQEVASGIMKSVEDYLDKVLPDESADTKELEKQVKILAKKQDAYMEGATALAKKVEEIGEFAKETAKASKHVDEDDIRQILKLLGDATKKQVMNNMLKQEESFSKRFDQLEGEVKKFTDSINQTVNNMDTSDNDEEITALKNELKKVQENTDKKLEKVVDSMTNTLTESLSKLSTSLSDAVKTDVKSMVETTMENTAVKVPDELVDHINYMGEAIGVLIGSEMDILRCIKEDNKEGIVKIQNQLEEIFAEDEEESEETKETQNEENKEVEKEQPAEQKSLRERVDDAKTETEELEENDENVINIDDAAAYINTKYADSLLTKDTLDKLRNKPENELTFEEKLAIANADYEAEPTFADYENHNVDEIDGVDPTDLDDADLIVFLNKNGKKAFISKFGEERYKRIKHLLDQSEMPEDEQYDTDEEDEEDDYYDYNYDAVVEGMPYEERAYALMRPEDRPDRHRRSKKN